MAPTRIFSTDNTGYSASITYDGNVFWYSNGIVTTQCKLDLTYFPFDQQDCYIHVEMYARTYF